MDKNSGLLPSTLKIARILFFAIALQATVFVFWGSAMFMFDEKLQVGGFGVYIVFALMGAFSFAYGVRFFRNYLKVKGHTIMVMAPPKRKEMLLLLTAIQFLLLEFVCVIGIFLSLFVQKQMVVYPFFVIFLVGMGFSYPKPQWYENFFKDVSSVANT